MRKLVALLFLFPFFYLPAQNTLSDTVKIPEVSIQAAAAEKPSVRSVDSILLHQSTQRDLGEVLAQGANVFVKSYGIGSQATVSLRGSGSAHTAVLWNGVSLNSSMNGVSDLALYPTLFLDQATVNYGNSSLQHAAGGIGGAILLENETQFKDEEKISLQQQFGSFAYNSTAAKVKVGNSKWQSVSRLFYRSADNNFTYRDFGEAGLPNREVENAALEQRSFMQTFSYRLKEKQTVEAHFWYYDSDRNLPPVITLSDIQERQQDESLRLFLRTKNYFQDGYYSLNVSVLKDELIYSNNRLERSSISENLSYRNFAELEKNWQASKFYARFNFDIEQAEHPSFASKIQRERLSLYTSFSHQWSKKFNTEISARSEWIVEEEQFFLPLLALNYHVNSAWTTTAQVSRNLKYPSLNDLYWEFGGNPDLKAEENQSVELGLSYQKELLENRLKLEWVNTAYYSEIDNYIQWQPTALGYWQAFNLRNVEIKGLESSLKLTQNKGSLKKSFFANYTYTQSLNQSKQHDFDDSKGKQLIYIPENQLNLQARLEHKGYSFFYQWQFVGERYTTSDNSEWQDDYSISNVGVAKQFKRQQHSFLLEFSVLNVFDLEYHAIQWRPMPNRNYQISFTYQLN